MDWFTAKIVFVILKKDGGVSGYDEQLRLIRAADAREAWVKADLLGQLNQDNEHVKWEYKGVADLQPINGEPGEGTELFYQIREPDNRLAYENWLKMKKQLLEDKLFSSEKVKG